MEIPKFFWALLVFAGLMGGLNPLMSQANQTAMDSKTQVEAQGVMMQVMVQGLTDFKGIKQLALYIESDRLANDAGETVASVSQNSRELTWSRLEKLQEASGISSFSLDRSSNVVGFTASGKSLSEVMALIQKAAEGKL